MPLADAATSANNGSDCAMDERARSVDVPPAANQSNSRLVKRIILSPCCAVLSHYSLQHGFHFVRVKIQLCQMRTVLDLPFIADYEDPARPSLIGRFHRTVHPVHKRREGQVQL